MLRGEKWAPRPRAVAAVTGAVIGVLALAACGSSSSGTSSGSTARQGDVRAATRQLAPYQKLGKTIGTLPALPNGTSGKTVDFLEHSETNSELHGDALKAAFAKLGITLRVINGGATPDSWQTAWQTIVQNPAQWVIYDTQPYQLAKSSISRLTAKHIPVVGIANPDLPTTTDTFSVSSGKYFHEVGGAMANWAIVSSQGAGNILYLKDTTFSFEGASMAATMATLKKNCPGCHVSTLAVPAADSGTSAPGIITSYLQRHTGVTEVIAVTSLQVLGVPAQLRLSGAASRVKIICFSPTTVENGYLKQDQLSAAVSESTAATGWYAADAMARMLGGVPGTKLPATDAAPPMTVVLTPKDVTWDTQEEWPYIPGWEGQFTKAWGASHA